jgi:hypothetical protein
MNLNSNSAYRPWNLPDQFNKDHDMVHELFELWGNLGFEKEFPRELRDVTQWGKYQNRLVVVDLGLSSDIMTTHYANGKTVPRPVRGLGRVDKKARTSA